MVLRHLSRRRLNMQQVSHGFILRRCCCHQQRMHAVPPWHILRQHRLWFAINMLNLHQRQLLPCILDTAHTLPQRHLLRCNRRKFRAAVQNLQPRLLLRRTGHCADALPCRYLLQRRWRRSRIDLYYLHRRFLLPRCLIETSPLSRWLLVAQHRLERYDNMPAVRCWHILSTACCDVRRRLCHVSCWLRLRQTGHSDPRSLPRGHMVSHTGGAVKQRLHPLHRRHLLQHVRCVQPLSLPHLPRRLLLPICIVHSLGLHCRALVSHGWQQQQQRVQTLPPWHLLWQHGRNLLQPLPSRILLQWRGRPALLQRGRNMHICGRASNRLRAKPEFCSRHDHVQMLKQHIR